MRYMTDEQIRQSVIWIAKVRNKDNPFVRKKVSAIEREIEFFREFAANATNRTIRLSAQANADMYDEWLNRALES